MYLLSSFCSFLPNQRRRSPLLLEHERPRPSHELEALLAQDRRGGRQRVDEGVRPAAITGFLQLRGDQRGEQSPSPVCGLGTTSG